MRRTVLDAPSLFTFDAAAWRTQPLEAFDSFLSNRRLNGRLLRPSSFAIYRGMFLRLQEWLGARGLILEDLDASRLESFLDGRDLAAETRHRYLLIFTELYQHLAILRDEENNPARELLTSQPAPERVQAEALTPQEVRTLLQVLREARKPGWKSRRLVAMVCLLLGAGLRTAELLSMRVRDVNQKDGVPVSLWVMPHRPRRERTVPLSELSREALQLWLPIRARLGLPVACELLFPGKLSGAPLSAATLFRQIQGLLDEADISRRYEGPMLLRNTRAAAWLASNPPYKVKDWLGHEQERTSELMLGLSESWGGQPLLDQALRWPPLAVDVLHEEAEGAG